MNRITTSMRLFLSGCFALLVAAAFFDYSPSAAGQEKKFGLATVSDEVAFQVRVRPEDPFDSNNGVKSDGKWKARRGELVRVELVGTLKDKWHMYPINQRTARQGEKPTILEIEKTHGITPLWPIYESEPESYKEKTLGYTVFRYSNTFTWSQDVLVGDDAPMGTIRVPIKLTFQACADSCVDFTHTVSAAIEVSDEAPIPPSREIEERLKITKPSVTIVKIPGEEAKDDKITIIDGGLIKDSHDGYAAKMNAIAKAIVIEKAVPGQDDTGLLAFMLTGVFWGAVSLITPCVFPMIPITVSFFLKQSEKEHHRPFVMAGVYSLTIVIVLTFAAWILLAVFQQMSVHPITNYVIGGLFVFFALSLFGMYEIELPQSLAQFTSSREGKGGVIGTMFMALTFTIISFACVAPFLGGFGGTAAESRPWVHNILGALAFSVTFASPFFFLALFPALLRRLPKSGSWLNSVKVVMGFLELAAAFKFFRTAELIHSAGAPSLFTFDFVLGLWIAMSVLCGIYLIGIYRLPHDSPEEHIPVPRLLLSVAFLGLALYLTPALFDVDAAGQSQRPGGAVYSWIDAFLLPDSHGDSDIPHTANLDFAVTKARNEFKATNKAKRIFIDFTGVTCSNCKINEKSVFTKPAIKKLFEPYIFVKLYTDTVPAEYYAAELRSEVAARSEKDGKQVNMAFRDNVFDKRQLPLYVILEPQLDGTVRVVRVYDEGRINNETAFAEFLANPEKK